MTRRRDSIARSSRWLRGGGFTLRGFSRSGRPAGIPKVLRSAGRRRSAHLLRPSATRGWPSGFPRGKVRR